MATDTNLEKQALDHIASQRFNQRYTLPATAEHDDLTVSYAYIGGDAIPDLPTVLFMPGMFASRYLGIFLDAVAAQLGVRIIAIDRPGMGQSTDVSIEKRIPVWIETVPRILEHLNIKHVALVSHSFGTVYLLNTLYHHRHLLHPERPFVALFAPWVDASISRVTTMQLAQYIPESAFKLWHHIPRFFVLTAQPTFASSGTVFSKASTLLGSGATPAADESLVGKSRTLVETKYGVSQELQTQLSTSTIHAMFHENTAGADSEALQCLRKGGGASWEKCGDYRNFIEELAGRERQRLSSGTAENGQSRLTIRSYFGETDALIGKSGQAYVEDCWKGTAGQAFHEVFDYESATVQGADHDTASQDVAIWEEVLAHLL